MLAMMRAGLTAMFANMGLGSDVAEFK